MRTLASSTPSVTYSSADQVADFGALPAEISIAISQISPTEGPGLAATRVIHV